MGGGGGGGEWEERGVERCCVFRLEGDGALLVGVVFGFGRVSEDVFG